MAEEVIGGYRLLKHMVTGQTSQVWEVVEVASGRHFAIQNLGELPDVAEKIGLELRNEYVLGYRPKNDARDGKYRKVEVKLVKVDKLPKLKSRARSGYYAPAQ